MQFSRFTNTVLRATGISVLILSAALCAARPPASRRHHGRSVSAQEAHIAARKADALRKRLRGLHGHMHSVRAKIHQARAKENRITESIGTVQARLAKTKARLARVNSHIRVLGRQHTQTVQRLNATEQRLAERRRLLALRVCDNYQRGQASYTQVLVQSRSIHELLSRGTYVRQIVRSDADLIHGVQQDIVQIDSDKRLIEAQQRQQQALESEFEEQKSHYAADLDEQRILLTGVQEVRAQAEDELDDLENEANAMTSNIRELSEVLQRRREAEQEAARAARKTHRRPHGSDDNSDDEPPTSVAPVWHGGFIRPVAGPITSGFGSRFHPILHRRKMHTGVDFGAGYGAPIHAAGGGTVILAQYTNGYGNCVVIDHGNGVTTLYGHCSSLAVSVGQVVTQGQIIARVGATGMATGPHLHWEVRRNGVPVSPL